MQSKVFTISFHCSPTHNTAAAAQQKNRIKKMKWTVCVVVLLCSALAWDAVSAKKRANNKYEGDFEFVVSVFPPPTIMIKESDRRRESK